MPMSAFNPRVIRIGCANAIMKLNAAQMIAPRPEIVVVIDEATRAGQGQRLPRLSPLKTGR